MQEQRSDQKFDLLVCTNLRDGHVQMLAFFVNDPEFFGTGAIGDTGQLGPKRALHGCNYVLELWGPLTQKD